jgi:Helix-turn-helix domain
LWQRRERGQANREPVEELGGAAFGQPGPQLPAASAGLSGQGDEEPVRPCPNQAVSVRTSSSAKSQEDVIESRRPTISHADMPVTISLMTAAKILGIGRIKAYELARQGEFPCLIIRVGDLYRVSTADLLRLLGTNTGAVQAPPTAA